MKLKYPALLALFMVPVTQATVFINEIHYDNIGGDVGEAIEIAATAGTDLSGMSLVLYNGNGNKPYGSTIYLSGIVADQQGGFGTISISFPSNGLQNGDPDGLALIDASGNVIQFLSYEGTITATDGPALGLTSVDIMVAENNDTTAIGTSLQLVGTGSVYENFSWAASSTSSFGSVNASQVFEDGDTGGGSGGDIVSGSVCTLNDGERPCLDVPKVKDASAFNATEYYAAAQTEIDFGQSAEVIKSAINTIISSDIQSLSYDEVWTALTYTDEDPNNSDNLILWYTGRSQAKSTNGSGGTASSNGDNWNREHSWPKSHGFPNESQLAYTDIHHLRATDISVNSSRSNLDFDNSDSPLAESPINRIDSDSFEPRNDIKGDVARMMFYMDTRYEGSGSDGVEDLVLVNRLTSSSEPNLGFLCTLIAWNNADAVDASEQRRNDRIYELQGNRNPFIDNPTWVSTLYPADSCDTSGGDTGGGDTGGDTGGGDTGGSSTQGDLFISEYVEASYGNNKAIELFNPTDREIDLSSASYVLSRFTNGSSTVSGSVNLIGVVPPMSTFVIANTGAIDVIKTVANMLSGQISHNGDDAYVLFKDGEVLDSFGRVGEDPGSAWGTGALTSIDNSLVRKATIYRGDLVVDNEFDPATEWVSVGKDVFSSLGRHNYQAPEIFISEYVEGSGSNKAIEIYNPAFASVDLAAGNYVLSLFSNGATSPSMSYSFATTIAANDVFVVVNSSSVQALKILADDTSGAINHNGDDAYVLYKDGVVIDSFGRVGERAVWGSGDTTSQNDTLVRKASIVAGDLVIDDSFDPALEWDGYAQDTFDNLGFHISTGGSGGGDTGGGTVELGLCADPATLISAIQGSGLVSPVVGETHVVEAVVSAAFTNLSGFFVQEEASDMDADSQTSEGLFVYYPGTLPAVGTVVRLVGKVEEFYEKTQLNVATSPLECGSDVLVATSFSLPFADALVPESLEGMLVTANSELIVTDNYSLGKYGEVALANQRLFVPTNLYPAGSDEAIAVAAQNALSKITLDDGMNGVNPEPVIYPTGHLSATNTLRGGDTVSRLTGIMDYSFNLYRVIPTEFPSFVVSNPRTAAPDLTLGNLTVASLNVLNLFNGDGLGGGFPTARGATNAIELERQMTKTVAALAAMDADIVGLMEIENDGFGVNSAVAQLTDRLNAVVGANTYTFVNGGGVIGTDEIKVALLYKPAKVSPVGSYKILNSSNSISDGQGPLFVDTKNRPAFNQKFALAVNAQEIVVSVNHLKSKGSNCGAGDDDTTTGQGSCNLTRTRAAQALTAFLAQEYADTPTLIIGDLNAYAQEDPILKIKQAGYTDLANLFQGAEAYSYAFGGEYGYLDHALANNLLLDKVVDTVEWHINADEPIVLDYNIENKSAQQQNDYYAPDAYRMSDHDPVVISMLLKIREDYDGDDDVDQRDIVELTKAIAKKQVIDIRFDLNGDGIVNIRDVRIMQQRCTRRNCAVE